MMAFKNETRVPEELGSFAPSVSRGIVAHGDLIGARRRWRNVVGAFSARRLSPDAFCKVLILIVAITATMTLSFKLLKSKAAVIH